MSVPEPYPELDELLASVGQAGQRLAAIDASEGAAGNISIFIGWPMEIRRRFPITEPLELPVEAPALAGGLVICTGSGRRLRDVRSDPTANLGVAAIGADGRSAILHTSQQRLFERLTSEWNSHLAVHNDLVEQNRHQFPRRHPCAAAPPYLPEPHPGVRRRGLLQRQAPSLGTRDDHQPAERHRRASVRRARIGRAHGGERGKSAPASSGVVEQARRHGTLGPVGDTGRGPDRVCGDGGRLRVHGHRRGRTSRGPDG